VTQVASSRASCYIWCSMTVSIIVATARGGVIGKTNSLPWYLPAEMAYFRAKTAGHPIIMGRKTHESIGRALPKRTNIIITSDPDYKADGCKVVGSLNEALEIAKQSEGAEEIFIIGGESIYTEAEKTADKIYLTKIDADIDGDRFFRFDESKWRQVSGNPHQADSENQYDYDFTVLERKR